MGKMLDITGSLSTDMWSYRPGIPDIPPFEHRRWATIEERGWEADWFAMPTLAGTYLETGKHLFEGVISIDQVPLDRLSIAASVAVIPKNAREHITVDDLEHHVSGLESGNALLVSTGWDRYWFDDGSTFVTKSPHFTRDAMQWIVDRGVTILGGDFPAFDDPDEAGSEGVNTILFGADALILAPLVRLSEWGEPRAHLTVLPIPLQGACGAPCRAMLTESRQERTGP
jgi:arylformamidase